MTVGEIPAVPASAVTVDAAVARVRSDGLAVATEVVALADAVGRVLAADVVALRDQPPFRASAMDGYAIRSADLIGGERVELTVVGESQAGRAYDGAVRSGEAVRIFTGAPIPGDCGAVVLQEYADVAGNVVSLHGEALKPRPAHMRAAGQDFRAGDVLLAAGVRLDAWRLSLVAAAGQAMVTVARPPRMAVLCTGDELVLPGETPRADQIYESASHALIALARAWGAEARYLGVGRDDAAALVQALGEVEADLIVTVGGASVGDHDLVKPALGSLGLRLAFDGVRVRPGKPTSFGVLADGRRVLGLPGNPASAFVMAQLLLKAWIEASLGVAAGPAWRQAVSVKPIAATGPREAYLRARLSYGEAGEVEVTVFDDQDSSLIQVFAQADVLVRLRAGAAAVAPGDVVEILALERL